MICRQLFFYSSSFFFLPRVPSVHPLVSRERDIFDIGSSLAAVVSL